MIGMEKYLQSDVFFRGVCCKTVGGNINVLSRIESTIVPPRLMKSYVKIHL